MTLTVIGVSLLDLQSNDGTLLTLIEDTSANNELMEACCCEGICEGCNKWVSDLSGGSVATVTIDGCGTIDSWSALEEIAGNANCVGPQRVPFPEGVVFTTGNFVITWSDALGKWEGTIEDISFLSADCSLDVGSAEEIEYECTECYFKISLSIPVVDLGGCFCAGPVIFTLELDLTTGPDCP